MAAMNDGQISVNPLSGALGAEIGGVDLSQPLDNKTFSDIYQAFLDHLVIFFRDQVITRDQQKAFSRRFGKLHIHPLTEGMEGHPEVIEIIKEPEERHNWGDRWHIDLTGLERPTLGSVLYAKEVPDYCGDTQWANMYLAYETLSDGMKKLIDGLVCVNTGWRRRLQKLQGHATYRCAAHARGTSARAHSSRHRKEIVVLESKVSQTLQGHDAGRKRTAARLSLRTFNKPGLCVQIPLA